MPIHWTGNPEADRLLEANALALLIGLVLDQQVRMEKAFIGPYELAQRIGDLDAAKIAAMDPTDVDAAFRQRPALHRFPGTMARRVQRLCQVIVDQYGGNAEAIWRGLDSGDELARRVGDLPGFGEEKSRITISVLAKRLGVQPPGWERHAANWHSIADVDSPASMAEVRELKRQIKAARRS
jgi:uncharacterized HhH-GPD family protein